MLRQMTADDHFIDDLVKQFLAIKSDPDVSGRSKTPLRGNPRITGTGENMQIVYNFTPSEVKILRVIHEVTGAPMEWLAADAINWTRSYIDDLVTDRKGQLEDLIDKDNSGACPVDSAHGLRTRLFLKCVQSGWTVQRSEAA
jgi:hypothetical protein